MFKLLKNFIILSAVSCMMVTLPVFASDRVTHLPGLSSPLHRQYAGYAPTQKGNALFYWFVGNTHARQSPLILWSNGGPGYSSLYGFFEEIGPYYITSRLTLHKNDNSFSNFANLLVIDQPAGIGFSKLKSPIALKNREDAISQYYQALYYFLKKHPAYQHDPLYLSGESYAGTYLPLLAKKIITENKQHHLKINIKAIIVMSPWADPLSQQSMDAQYAYHHGLITQNDTIKINKTYKQCAYLINAKKYRQANTVCMKIGVNIQNFSGLPDLANIAYTKNDNDSLLENYLNQFYLKKAVHVSPDATFSCFSEKINQKFLSDIQLSVINDYDFLLSHHIKIVIFSGLNDAKDTNFLGVKRFIQKMQWPGKNTYQKGVVKKIYDIKNGRVMGYQKSGGGLTFITILNAGHMVPKDVPSISTIVQKQVE